MNFPKLKNALLCRILVYVVVLGGFIAPIVIAANLSFIHDDIKTVVLLACIFALLAYMIKNFALLMMMDFVLTALHCKNTARKRFALPRSFDVKRAEKKLSKFGKKYSPTLISPMPCMLRYKSNASIGVFSSGIERVVAVYQIDYLDKALYHSIINSAVANSVLLQGQKKHLLLDKSQRKAPLNRATVIVIFAKQVECDFRDKLFVTVCQNGGGGYDTATIPCVVDLETRFATFDSERIPYVGYQYPVKNRGIRIIRKCLFDGRLPFSASPNRVDPLKDIDPEQSLWSFWSSSRKEMITSESKARRLYKKMKHRELIFDDGYVYLKWEDKGIWVSVKLDEETKIAEIDTIDSWYYPKQNKIAKKTIKEIKSIINSYFAELGYTTKFLSYD